MAATLEFFYSGGGSNSDPELSLGGSISSANISTTSLNNLFQDAEPPWTADQDSVQYVGINLKNTDGSYLARNVTFYFVDTPNVESTLAVWNDTTGTQSIPDQDTIPTGSPSWTTPLIGSKLSLGDLAAGASHRLWIRRTVIEGAVNIQNDTAVLNSWYS